MCVCVCLQSGRRYTPSGLDFSFMKSKLIQSPLIHGAHEDVCHAPLLVPLTVSQAHSHLPLQPSHPISQTPVEVSYLWQCWMMELFVVARYKGLKGENLYSVLSSCVQIQEAIKGLDTWEFDIISMESISKRR